MSDKRQAVVKKVFEDLKEKSLYIYDIYKIWLKHPMSWPFCRHLVTSKHFHTGHLRHVCCMSKIHAI